MSDFETNLLAVLRDLTESIDALTDELLDLRDEAHDMTHELDDLGDGLRARS